MILTEKAAKPALLAELLKSEPVDRVLVFTRTKHGADKVVRALEKAGLRRRGDPRQQVAEPARARARRLPRRQAAHPDRHRHRRPRHRRRRRQPCVQLRSAEHPGNLRPPHRPHRARRRRGHRDLVLRSRGSPLPARHRAADPDDDPGDRPAHGERPAHRPAPQHAASRDNGRPHRNGNQQRGNGGGNGRNGNNGHRARNGGHRPTEPANGHQNGHHAGPPARSYAGGAKRHRKCYIPAAPERAAPQRRPPRAA